MPRTKKQPKPATPAAEANGLTGEVMTLPEAAAYLRLSESDVLQFIAEQGLPARHLGKEWRFFKAAIQHWLSQPLSTANREGIWAFAGAWKDDPHVEEMLQEIYRKRGHPTSEE